MRLLSGVGLAIAALSMVGFVITCIVMAHNIWPGFPLGNAASPLRFSRGEPNGYSPHVAAAGAKRYPLVIACRLATFQHGRLCRKPAPGSRPRRRS
jgi:hypothetical protein